MFHSKLNKVMYLQALISHRRKECGGLSAKTLLIMKLTFALLMVSCLQVSATGFGQTVSLAEKNASLQSVFKKIERQTGYYFWYEGKVLAQANKISLDVRRVPLQAALDLCFRDQPLSYSIVGQTIVVRQKSLTGKEGEALADPLPPPIRVSGVVFSADMKPLSGASVSLKGSNIGTTTDAAGKFTLDVPAAGATLLISYIGYEPSKIVVSKSTDALQVVLKRSDAKTEEVVVIGYGTARRREVNGSVSTVKAEDLNVESNTNFAQALAGRAPGLLAIQTTGQPGASVNLQIRDNPSFASAGVLYVLDGVPINATAGDPGSNPQYGGGGVDRSPLNFINPNDIESIEILKDASAASIYGAQAGAGVVLITTKRGKGDKPKLEYGFSQAFQKQAKFFDLLNTRDYMTQRNDILHEAWLKNNGLAPYGNTDPTTVTPFVPKYSQQQIDTTPAQPSAIKAISRNGFVQQHNVSLSGTSGKTRYFISGNYLDQQGVIKGTDYTRYNARVNLDQTITDHLKAGINFSTSNSTAGNQAIQTSANEAGGIILSAFYYPANLPLVTPAGNYPLSPDYPAIPNPLSYLTVTDQTKFNRLLTNGFAEWEIISGLKARANFSYDQSTSKRSVYEPKTFLFGANGNGVASIGEANSNTKLLEYTLSYAKNIGSAQRINALAGYSYQVTNYDGLNAANNNFLTDQFLYNNIGAGTAPRPTVGSYAGQQTWASYFARAIYSLYDKYFLTASLRRDGSSIFAENKKYGYFPSFSAGWLASQEEFFRPLLPVVNYLKVRASYGATGNSNIGQNAFAYYSANYNYVFNNTQNTGVALSQIANTGLTWETARELNAGIDFQLLDRRISGSVDYFNKTISNLLSFVPLTTDFPVASVASNAGKTRTKGWEIGLQTKNIVAGSPDGFEWNTSITLSHFYSNWIERSPSALKTLAKYIDPKGQFQYADGSGAIYGYVAEGIYNGKAAPPAQMPGLIPGGIIIKDFNGYDAAGNLTGKPDGALSSADEKYLGSTTPKLSFGINNTFRYHHFDLSVYMYGTTGALKYNSDYNYAFSLQSNLAQFGWNTLTVTKGAWSSTNPNGKWPNGLNTGYEAYTGSSSFWYEKADFLRCRDITLGYTFPGKLIQGQHLFKGLRLSVDLQNMFTLTSYKGLDPELQSFVAYPLTRSVVFGLNASF